jgi:adenine-specific DNA-methyltransferase
MLTRPVHLLLEEENQSAIQRLIQGGHSFQLIYMDPPYNTGRLRGARKDYRDTIKREWQETMTQIGRLAHQALKDSGFLAVSINQMELFNLQPILDRIFGDGCFIGVFPIKIRHKDRQLMINATMHDLFEYLLVYRKNKKTRFFTEAKTAREDKFIYAVRPKGEPSERREINGKQVEIYQPGTYDIVETGYTPNALRRYVIAGKLATANWSGEWFETHLRPLGNDVLIKVYGLENAGLGYRWFQTGNERRNSGVYFQSQLNAGRPVLPCNDLDYTEVVPTIYREGGPGCDFKDSKKPEALLRFLLGICTQPGDLVLDPYGGSGTTLGVAVKMKRRSVLIDDSPASCAIIKQRAKNLQEGNDTDGLRHFFELADNLEAFQTESRQKSEEVVWLDPVRRDGDLFDLASA